VKSDMNEPISHSTLADRVFSYLAKAILSGELRAGERLIETELSERLGISRAPLREALAELEKQGLAYSLVRRGTFVKPWTKQDLWEVAVLRSTLESLVAELATSYLVEDDIAFLEKVIDEMEIADLNGDVDRQIDLDFQFHDRILERCPNSRLKRLVDDMRLQVRIFRVLTKGTSDEPYPGQHRRILDALKTGDPQAARKTMHAHVMDWMELALAGMPDEGTVGELGSGGLRPPTGEADDRVLSRNGHRVM